MSSRAGQLVAAPSWGALREVRSERLRARAVRFGIVSSPVAEAAGAALVLGGSVGLWAAVLLALW